MSSTRSSFLSGALKLGSGQIINQSCSFARSIILARLISPENFGIAATFAMTFALMEMVSNVSVQTLLIQAADGDDAEFQATGHSLLALRGVISAAVLFLLATPLSTLFGVPQARWAFYWIAAIPLIRGFIHLDLSRLQRQMRFTPQVGVDAVSNVVVTLLAWPLAAWLRDYSAMLWLLLLQAVLFSVGSQLVARRQYHLSWNRDYMRRFLSFGWPLLVNGLLMYGILQGDRFVIGTSRRLFEHSAYTLKDLGLYSVAFAVTMAPSSLFVNVSTSLFLPLLSRAQNSQSQFERRYVACSEVVSFSALLITVPFALVGPFIVPLVYGAKYIAAGTLIGWLGAMWGLRIFRAAPTLAAMALGDTRNSMISNIVRSTALVGMLLVAASGRPLVWIAICGFIGEGLASVVCIWRLQVKHHVNALIPLRPFAICAAGIGAAAACRLASLRPVASVTAAAVIAVVCASTMLLCFPELLNNMRGALMRYRSTATETAST